ncbi:glycosyltransferase family 2 protein [Pediococcus stilesii]|uniref:Glycosyl transferase n=1 Tax=Pediococcus stilesii TaxID=331679 RepID=A0A0R2L230_9LACO|nr:glycosyltransferase [Pediococcus stilesii]KRN92596.1 glycosyl transferase [Pediococcus stilesii]
MFTNFIILYPLVMTMIWIIGSLMYQFRKNTDISITEQIEGVSILIPCFNEQDHLEKTVRSLVEQQHRKIEIVLIDDASVDNTLDVMNKLKKIYKDIKIEVVKLQKNSGKAAAMNEGIKFINYKYVLCIDADSLINTYAIDQLVSTLNKNPQLGAVTGKPQTINRNTMIEKMQAMEYTAIIDLIKRSQFFFTGRILTLSGVIALFRKEAIESVSGWDPNVQTEDIDITWRLSEKSFYTGYNPEALTWILVPHNFRSLLKQRLRWAYGGLQMLIKNRKRLLLPFKAETWLLYEMIVSIFWSFITLISSLFFFINIYLSNELHLDGNIILIIILTGLAQFIVGLFINKSTSKIRWFVFLYVPLYLFFYWLVNLYAIVTAVFKLVYAPKNNGRWASPKRIVD